MATYNRLSQFRYKYLRKLCGSAIYAELAIACGGVWNRTELENLIDGKQYGEYTGRYRKMCNGTIPYETNCKNIQNQLEVNQNHKCSIIKWRELPLWRLLSFLQPDTEDIKYTLLTIKGETRNYIWDVFPEEEQFKYLFSRKPYSKNYFESVAQLNNFEALLTLTAWAREARGFKDYSSHKYCAKYSRKIFAHAVCNTPQLFIRWPILYQYYIEPIWSLYSNTDLKELKISEVQDEIYEEEKTARLKGVQLPPKKVFREINKSDIKLCLNRSLH